MGSIYGELLNMKILAEDEKQKIIKPYIIDYYNTQGLFKNPGADKFASTRMVNALIEAMNKKDARLPKYLIVIIDKDILADLILDDQEQNDSDILRDFRKSTISFVKLINSTLRRKRMDIYDKRPEAIASCDTKLIFVRMIRRIGTYRP